jgi:hypothetical protein
MRGEIRKIKTGRIMGEGNKNGRNIKEIGE